MTTIFILLTEITVVKLHCLLNKLIKVYSFFSLHFDLFIYLFYFSKLLNLELRLMISQNNYV